jgi:tetratricopeptide (TPR) repeat protein
MTEGKRPSAGMELLRKGRENNPESWKLLFETGFIYYISWEDYEKAAEYFTEAARIPGAPEYTKRFAAFVTQRAGELQTSILLWQELAERTSNPQLREKARKKVEELTALLHGRKP